MSPELANFLFETVNFLVFAAALGWLVFKPLRRALEREQGAHAEQGAALASARQELEAVQQAIRGARDTARIEADRERREVLEAARVEATRIVDEAKSQREVERKTFEGELSAMVEEQERGLADRLGQVAASSVEKLLIGLDGPPLESALVRAACERLRTMAVGKDTVVLVDTARPLGPEELEALRAAVNSNVSQRVVPELGAGIRVTTSAGQVDVSASAFSRAAYRSVHGALEGAGEPARGQHAQSG